MHGFITTTSPEPTDEVSETYNTGTDTDDDVATPSALHSPPILLSGTPSTTQQKTGYVIELPSLTTSGVSPVPVRKHAYTSPLSLASMTIAEETKAD